MGTKCNGCDSGIFEISYMECSQETCKNLFHLKCLAITEKTFEAFTQEYKENWICPECIRNIPKRDNSDTPVRGNTIMNRTFTPTNFVNTERRRTKQTDVPMVENECNFFEMMREFRFEMKNKLDEQIKAYKQLEHKFISTEKELIKVQNILKVVQEKASKVDSLENKIKILIEKNERLESRQPGTNIKNNREAIQLSPVIPKSFASTVKQNQNAKEFVATKQATTSATTEVQAEKISSMKPNTEEEIKKKETEKKKESEEWTVIHRKKNRYPNSEVKRGDNTTSLEIQGTERKKYLHVWRLKKETTTECVETHVRKICGQDIAVKVEKIKHKSERDYASFIIGVPESKYQLLCQPENWAVNIEFCEWVWFRKPANKSKNQ